VGEGAKRTRNGRGATRSDIAREVTGERLPNRRVHEVTLSSVSAEQPVAAPPWWRTVAESRAAFEFGAFLAASPLLRLAGRGDQHPVLVLPGFTSTDFSTEPLRWFLRGQGYWCHGWHLGRNLGPTDAIVAGIAERLIELGQRYDRRVSLVGWSLGGIYARMLAQRYPDLVRAVITMGSPYRLVANDHTAFDPLWNRISPAFTSELAEVMSHLGEPLAVPTTAIYTKGDGIVDWHTCVQDEGPMRENIEVHGSHAGLGWNPAVLYAVSDRLRQPEDSWKPFHAPRGFHLLFGNVTGKAAST
jgi:pimeloyl-ACP methyl ester carboxylesterase